jgi:site-specific DNA-methyltransferase (adenine-specific)
MEAMKLMSDKAYELAIVDPPYGIGQDWKKRNNNKERYKQTSYKNEKIPNRKYFKELMRISTNQIIWGYNYYTKYLGPTNYLIVWDKQSNNNDVFKYSKCEIAYTSVKIPANLISIPWDGYRMGAETGIRKIHPHQKPVSLYKWLLQHYAKSGDKILDTHLGSGSIAIACDILGFDLDGYEVDGDYFKAASERLEHHRKQLTLDLGATHEPMDRTSR